MPYIRSYTHAVPNDAKALTTGDGASGPMAPDVGGNHRRFARPRAAQVALDAAGGVFAFATFAGLGEPDVLLHCLWVVLVIEAFAFGFRAIVFRIVAASATVVAYAAVAESDTPLGRALVTLDLAEWPLMIVIAIIVAVMADRVRTTSQRYAVLYRRTHDQLLTAQEDERRRLALDLHDGVGQTLTALTYTLDGLERTVKSGSRGTGRTIETARRARHIAELALDEVREVAVRLRPMRIAENGLAASVKELCATAGAPIEVEADSALLQPGVLPLEAEIEAFRIVQEAVGNSMRHAHASRRWVRMSETSNGRIVITIGDDGQGFDPGRVRDRGLGLHAMAERAAAVGGRIDVRSGPGTGTIVRLEIPLTNSGTRSGSRATATGGGIVGSEPAAAGGELAVRQPTGTPNVPLATEPTVAES